MANFKTYISFEISVSAHVFVHVSSHNGFFSHMTTQGVFLGFGGGGGSLPPDPAKPLYSGRDNSLLSPTLLQIEISNF